ALTLRPMTMLVDRQGALVRIRAEDGSWCVVNDGLSLFDSMMTHVADPRNAPEMLALRESIRAWRFYDHFRTDADAPVRSPQIGTHTPILGNDGDDLAAAIQTIREIGDEHALLAAVGDAFPKSRLEVSSSEGRFALTMSQHGLLRPLGTAELSDGTLRYLLWIAALLSPRPPALMVLNEPETSLHPDLICALARLIATAADRSQVVAVTHSTSLIDALDAVADSTRIMLEKDLGETVVPELTSPTWTWPSR